jgi:hypothetical protein
MVRSVLALAAVLSVASASLAGDLVTPLVHVGTNSAWSCKVLNITSAPIVVQYQMIQNGGTVREDSGPTTLAPDQGDYTILYGSGTEVFCRFLKASTSKVRAELTVFPNNDGVFADTLVVPAQ